MTQKQIYRAMVLALGASVALSSCSKDEPKPDTPDTPDTNTVARYAIATTVGASSQTAYVLLTSESLDEGTVTTERNGLKNDGATQWIFNGTSHLCALTYNQGNNGATESFYLGTDGKMHKNDIAYRLTSSFSSYGMYNDIIFTTKSNDGPAKFADANGNAPKTLTIDYLDMANGTSYSNNTSDGTYSVENYLGNGEYVTISGAEQSGSRLYCGIVPMGLSAYGGNYDGGKYILPGNEDLVAQADGGQGGGSYKKGELSGTQYPNECWVAIYSNETLTNPILAKTDKISYAAGRFRSQYYQTVWAADNGDIYVFSPSFAKTQTDARQKTALPAGVCRIPAGKTAFDDYYCNIEALSGGRSFMRCWSAGGNYFILAMYDTAEIKSTTSATGLAIFDADRKTLTDVTGIPEDVTSLGKTVYVQNGYVYIPINTASGSPAIYRIDPATGKANKGLVVEGATEINGFGYMIAQ